MDELFERWADMVPIENKKIIPVLEKAVRKRLRQGYSEKEIIKDIKMNTDGELVDWLDELWEDDYYTPSSRVVLTKSLF